MIKKAVDDLIREQLKDPEFAELYKEEHSKQVSAVAVFKAREAAGLTQTQLSERSGIPRNTIARIEKGHNTSIVTLSKIANALNMNLTLSIK
ncbi:helix-turn-helix domain-containing protein [Lapidilactobacillus salsurivasis]